METGSIIAEAGELFDASLRKQFMERWPSGRESFDQAAVEGAGQEAMRHHDWFNAKGAHYLYREGCYYYRGAASKVTVCVGHEMVLDVIAYEHARMHIDGRLRARRLDHARNDDEGGRLWHKYKGIIKNHVLWLEDHCIKCAVGLDQRGIFKIDKRCILLVEASDRTPGGSIPSPDKYARIVWLDMCDPAASSKPPATQMVYMPRSNMTDVSRLPDCFETAIFDQLHDRLGKKGLVRGSRTSYRVHQSIVTTSIFAAGLGCPVDYRTGLSTVRPENPEAPTLFLLHAAHQHTESLSLFEQVTVGGSSRSFPEPSEARFAAQKLGDIEVLDQIARLAPKKWAYRPKTCDGLRPCGWDGPCVVKRSHSFGSNHVILRGEEAGVEALACRSELPQANDASWPRWFHQEWVGELLTLGEFRIYILTEHAKRSLRNRKGTVRQLIHTIPSNDKILVQVLSTAVSWDDLIYVSADSVAFLKSGITLRGLQSFALYMFERIREQGDWDTKFPSLEVGVRLDIGIAGRDGSPSPFVNEITRIYAADYFSDYLGAPGLDLCTAVAQAMRENLLGLVPGSA